MKTLLKKLERIEQSLVVRLFAVLALAGLAGACAQPAIGGGGFAMAVCGNKVCEAGEVTSCPGDCAQGCQTACTAAVCTAAGEIQDCVTGQTGCKVLAAAKACPSGQKCSAGQCTGGGTGSVGCGDGVCSTGEKATCPLDCPGGCGSPCAASVCGPGGGVRECTAGPDGCSVLGAEKACPAGSQCTGDACVSLSKDHAKIESVKFFGEKTGFPTYLAPMLGKTIDGQKVSAVPELVLTNPTEEARDVTVKAWLQGYSEEGGSVAPVHLEPGDTKTLVVDIPFTCGKLDPIVTDIEATYKVAIYENGVEVDSRKAQVTMMPKGRVLWAKPGYKPTSLVEQKAMWHFYSSLMASMYSTKNDSWGEVDKLVAEANKLAEFGLTAVPFETKSYEELNDYATEALISIFKALKARGVAYSSVGTDYFESGQNVRYPAESLTVGSQNCIDGAMVFASALERMGYRPFLVLITGHAFIGVKAGDGPLAFIETTMVNSASAEKAVEVAMSEVLEHFEPSEDGIVDYIGQTDKPRSDMIDIRALHEAQKLPSSFFPCGAKPAPAGDPCGANPQCKCQKSLDCKRNGKCTVVTTGSGCGVVTSADCAKSTDCTDWGKCAAVMQNGEMVCGKAGTGPVCGNSQCEPGETAGSCPKDCQATGPVCGNAKCEMGENSANCIKDCPVAGPVCGNGKCESGENSSNCIKDCPVAGPVCGNGKCESGETANTCYKDCSTTSAWCGDLTCSPGEAGKCALDCTPKFNTAFSCIAAQCPAQWAMCVPDEYCNAVVNCVAQCGCDDACTEGCYADVNKSELTIGFLTCASKSGCANPCPASGPVCGNGLCEVGETKVSCAADCGPAGSCANNCGKQVGSCYCDAGCAQNGDCCPDYAIMCAASHPCDAACGGKAPTGCYCDTECKKTGDCCSATGQPNQYSCAGSTCGLCK